MMRRVSRSREGWRVGLLCEYNSRDVIDARPLALAVAGCHVDAVRLLLEASASTNIEVDLSGRKQAPIVTACATGNLEIVRLLLFARANVAAAECTRPTPLALAHQRGDRDIMKLLLEAGAVVF
ncbi:ANKEF1 [Symbiodinium natans]|uniref:ANKEF1 protein n=1 Tax=Symbiodinium natans TaxID=878477 RepID=A0A812S315_9DINO|nr:ANKEF1 [Symbiodinium natans]